MTTIENASKAEKLNTASSKKSRVTKKHKITATYMLVAAKNYLKAAKRYLKKTKDFVLIDHERVDMSISLAQEQLSLVFKSPTKDIIHPSEYE